MANTNFTPSPNEQRMPGPRHPRWPHLPDGPWRFVGFESRSFQACHGAPIQVGGSCDHCYTGIRDTYLFDAPSGERFKVGSTCVTKMIKQSRVDRDVPEALQAAEREIKAVRNKASRERATVKRAELKATAADLLASARAAAEALPHPNAYRAGLGDTLADWADFMLANGGGPAAENVIREIGAIDQHCCGGAGCCSTQG